MNTALAAETHRTPSPIWRVLVVVVLVALTLVACFWGAPPAAVSEDGVYMKLPDLVGRFQGKEQEVSNSELSILPKDTEFAKKLYTDNFGENINCQIVLAGAEKRSIHRPEVCLPGQGWTLKNGEVTPVTLDDGRTLQVMKLLIGRPVTLENGQQKELTSLFLYWFVGKDMSTPRHLVRILKTNFDMLLHNTNHRWAYVIVSAPILKGFAPNGQNQDDTLKELKSFIAELAPEIMKPSVKLPGGAVASGG